MLKVLEGILNQSNVEITWIVADILTNSVQFFKRLFFGFKFDFCDHQFLVCSMEFINLPAKISDGDFCPMFGQSWLFTDMFQKEFSIIDMDSIILLDPSKCPALSLEVELGHIPFNSDTNSYTGVMASHLPVDFLSPSSSACTGIRVE